MSSPGPTGNGLDTLTAVTARVTTFAPLDPVPSADLNSIQDDILLVSNAVDFAVGLMAPSRTCTHNQADSPNPDTYGGGLTWIEAQTNGTTVVVLDDEVDYRDRHIIVTGWVNEAASFVFPGEAGDDSVDEDLDDATTPGVGIHDYFYSEQGDPGTATPGMSARASVSSGNTLHVFVRDSDGALCLKLSPWDASEVGRIVATVQYSPMQNHY